MTYRPLVREIAEELLLQGGWGAKEIEDTLHIGYAIVSGADVLVTWDEADLARDKTRRLVRALCRRRGWEPLDIATPEEVLDEWLGIKIPSWRK